MPPNNSSTPIPPQPHSEAPNAYQPSGEHINPVDASVLGLFEHDPDEQLICQINRHPIGLFFIFMTTALIFLAITVAAFVVLRYAPNIGIDSQPFRAIAILFFGLLVFGILVSGYIATWIYQRSVIIVTSEKLVQLLQRNLFDRKISQLSIGDVQDVTVEQRGILARIFKYGTITIETAGEQQNYTFNFVPFPFECSKEIIGAHERNLKLYGN